MSELRAAINTAGRDLPPETFKACIDEAIEQFHRNNAVVGEFRLPLKSAAAAVGRLLAALRMWLLALLVVVLLLLVAHGWKRGAVATV